MRKTHIIKNDQKTLTKDTGDHGESGGSASSKKNGENDEKEASNAASSPVGGSDLTDETVDSHQPSLSSQRSLLMNYAPRLYFRNSE